MLAYIIFFNRAEKCATLQPKITHMLVKNFYFFPAVFLTYVHTYSLALALFIKYDEYIKSDIRRVF